MRGGAPFSHPSCSLISLENNDGDIHPKIVMQGAVERIGSSPDEPDRIARTKSSRKCSDEPGIERLASKCGWITVAGRVILWIRAKGNGVWLHHIAICESDRIASVNDDALREETHHAYQPIAYAEGNVVVA